MASEKVKYSEKNILIVFFALLISQFTAQTFHFKKFTPDNGLAQSQVLCSFQDFNGFMWFGTNSGGVSRYDGRRFLNFTKKNGLADNFVFSIAQDSHHNLFFATSNGLSIYDGFCFKNFSKRNGLTNPWIYKLYNKGDTIWMGTAQGVYSYVNGVIKKLKGNLILDKSLVYAINCDSKGNLWFGTTRNGIVVWNQKKNKFINIDSKSGLSNDFVFSILEVDGLNYIGTLTGISIIDSSYNAIAFDGIKGHENIAFTFLATSSDSCVYLGTYSNGLLEFNLKSKKIKSVYNSVNGLTNNPIYSAIKDKEGNFWIAASPGIFKFKNKKISYFTKNNGLPSTYVDAICIDSFDQLWIALAGDGLIKIKNGLVTAHYVNSLEKNQLCDNSIKCCWPTKEGKIYFGTESGLMEYSRNKFSTIQNNFFREKYIQCLFMDKYGSLWIGTNEGVFVFRNGKVTEEVQINKLRKADAEFMIFFINQGLNGEMYFGLEDGLIKLENGLVKKITTNNTSTQFRFCNGKFDARGNLWIGTADGLYLLSGDKLIKVDHLLNGNSSLINFIELDLKNRIYIGTNQDIKVLDLSDFYANKIKYKTINYEDGLLSVESNFNATAVDREGKILIGTCNGLEIYDPKLESLTNIVAHTKIEGIELSYGKENYMTYCDSISRSTGLPINLDLPFDKSSITFSFIAVSLSSPEKVKYTYKIVGLDDNWCPPQQNPEAIYPSLPPGSYTFSVKAMNSDGIWDPYPTTFNFRVRPPWYKTRWFYSIFITSIILLIIFFVKYRTSKIIREKEKLELVVQLRTLEIRKQKDIVEEKRNEILSSINYAKRIQDALLATNQMLRVGLNNHFVLFKPKDIVSGDFYWGSIIDSEKFILVTADSTGHGVPGAIMSILNISCLSDCVVTNKMYQPNEILNQTRAKIVNYLYNEDLSEAGKDGMDCSVLIYNRINNQITYSSANHPIWIIRHHPNEEKELIELTCDKMPVGWHVNFNKPFTKRELNCIDGDIIYTFTDGFADQFGGPSDKKFKYTNLKKLLYSISHKELNEQRSILEATFEDWKGKNEQTDDVLMIAFRVEGYS